MEKYYDTKERIYNSFINILNQKNYNHITIKEVLLSAKVSKATFYRHFRTLKDVIKYKAIQLTKKLLENYNGNIDYTKFTNIIFDFIYKHKDFYYTLYLNNILGYALDYNISIIGPDKNDSNEVAYNKSIFVYSLYGLIKEWMNRGMKESPDKMQLLANKNLKIKLY